VRRFREKVPGCAVRSSFIAGYPGEDEAAFENLLSFIKEADFDRVGVFTYSHEEMTYSSKLGGQVPEKVKADRQSRAMQLGGDISRARLNARRGSLMETLVEAPPGAPAPQLDGAEHGPSQAGGGGGSGDWYVGRSAVDAPGIDGKVYFKAAAGSAIVPGDFVRVRITDSDRHDLFGNVE
jgi:ribosomal protein S12 methylthiotransferase